MAVCSVFNISHFLIFFQNWFLPLNSRRFGFRKRVPGDWFPWPSRFTSTLLWPCVLFLTYLIFWFSFRIGFFHLTPKGLDFVRECRGLVSMTIQIHQHNIVAVCSFFNIRFSDFLSELVSSTYSWRFGFRNRVPGDWFSWPSTFNSTIVAMCSFF